MGVGGIKLLRVGADETADVASRVLVIYDKSLVKFVPRKAVQGQNSLQWLTQGLIGGGISC